MKKLLVIKDQMRLKSNRLRRNEGLVQIHPWQLEEKHQLTDRLFFKCMVFFLLKQNNVILTAPLYYVLKKSFFLFPSVKLIYIYDLFIKL